MEALCSGSTELKAVHADPWQGAATAQPGWRLRGGVAALLCTWLCGPGSQAQLLGCRAPSGPRR